MDRNIIETGIMKRFLAMVRCPATRRTTTKCRSQANTQRADRLRRAIKPSGDPFHPLHDKYLIKNLCFRDEGRAFTFHN